jgi:hypothetical protein
VLKISQSSDGGAASGHCCRDRFPFGILLFISGLRLGSWFHLNNKIRINPADTSRAAASGGREEGVGKVI